MLLIVFLLIFFGLVRTDDPLRPQYHLMPENGWLNDPNGPVYSNGYYHMFFQHTPNSSVRGLMHWGHCYSKDMVHWMHLPIALTPDHPYDIDGIFTGSTTIVNGVPVIIYTGITESRKQVQCQARPANLSDPTLTNWTKLSMNPLITDPNGRDPATAFQDSQNNYYLIYGYGTSELGGQAVIFTSKDFFNWTYLHPLHSNKNDKFWECPDIFNVSNRVVMKASLLGHDFWTVGNLDRQRWIFTPLNHDLGEFTQLVDYGRFYASKTFYDPIGDQQVVMGWVSEQDKLAYERGWQGIHSLPRAIFLSEDGLEIRSRPIEGLHTLRDPQSHRQLNNIPLMVKTPFQLLSGLSGNQIEIRINWQFPANQNLNFGLNVLSTPDGIQRTDIGLATTTNSTIMINWNLDGWDYFSAPNVSQWSECQNVCTKDNKCAAWTFVNSRKINDNCFLKSGIPLLFSKTDCVSGVKPRESTHQVAWVYINRTLSQKNPNASHDLMHAPLWLEPTSMNDDQWFVELDIFIDHSVIEIFEPQGGRFALTTRVYPEDIDANNIGIYVTNSTGDVRINTIDVWNLTTIWT